MTSQENDLFCRVEGDAPMGQLMRRHWLAACLSEEVPEADGAPVAVRLFGEDLVAWRSSDGRVGLMDRYCPHRRASLVYARNEDNGLRCLYHGWKMDLDGQILEMPSEPAVSGMAQKFRQTTYPTVEWGGFVWTYMGPPETMPAFEPPPFAASELCKVSICKIQVNCNWAQIIEGNIDSAHSSSLHSSEIRPSRGGSAQVKATVRLRPSTDKAPRIQVQGTNYGFKYVALRRPTINASTHEYLRMTVFMAPFTVLIPPNDTYAPAMMAIPMDDTHTMFYFMACAEPPKNGIGQDEWRRYCGAEPGVDLDAQYRNKRTPENNYLQDRQAMKQGSFTGIDGITNQDIVMWETMGPIAHRPMERLGASDLAIVEFRRQMFKAVKDFRDGKPAIGTCEYAAACNEQYLPRARLRAFEGVLPKSIQWQPLDTTDGQAEVVDQIAISASQTA
jgi:phthalate 4,5-dioxygenase oxygenase subunit